MKVGFSSWLAQDMDRFLAFKRALGHPYHRGEFTLRSFDHFVRQRTEGSRRVSLERLIHEWLTGKKGCKPVSIATELGVIRQFCLFRRRYDPDGFVPDRQWAPQSTESDFLPYIFSRKEILALLECAKTIRGPKVRVLGIRVLLLILYCTGLRLGEALRLQMKDVDMKDRLFIVRESKGKTRIVPFRADLGRELMRYLHERQRIVGASADGPFLIGGNGKAYCTSRASGTITRLLRLTGLKPPKGRVGPRPYDLRHAFAVHRLSQWYRSGVDIHARLPWLSAYMGHNNILGTEAYLRATPELLQVAGRSFEKHFRSAGRER